MSNVGGRLLERGLGEPDARRGDRDPALGERRQRDPVAVALGPEPVRDRDLAALEHELGRRAGPDAHLLLVGAEPEAGHLALDEEGRDARSTGCGVERREDQVALRLGRVADPDLRAGQPVRGRGVGRADSFSTRADRGRVRAGGRLGQREGAEAGPGLHCRQPAGSLLLGAPGHDRKLGQDVHRQADRGRHLGPRDLLHHERPAEVAEPGPADRLREGRGGQPEPAHAVHDRAIERLVGIAGDGAWRDLMFGELSRGGLEQPLLGRQGPAQVASSTAERSTAASPGPVRPARGSARLG